MDLFHIIGLFSLGLTLGSFYNVVGLRVPIGESIVTPPSHCPTCGYRLTALDLVPVVSYVGLKGACRSCSSKISPLYPVMEFLTGSLFALSYYTFGWSPELLVALLFVSLLIIITVSDITYTLIPNKVLLLFGILLFLARLWSPLTPWWDALLGAFVGFGLLILVAKLSLWLFKKDGMGGGDIKLYFVLGLVLGTKGVFLSLFLASVIGLFIGLLYERMKTKEEEGFPFGPAIAIAALLTYFFGSTLVDWYLSFFEF